MSELIRNKLINYIDELIEGGEHTPFVTNEQSIENVCNEIQLGVEKLESGIRKINSQVKWLRWIVKYSKEEESEILRKHEGIKE